MPFETTERGALDEARLPVAELAARMRLPERWAEIAGEAARLGRLLRGAIARAEASQGHAVLDRAHVLTGHAPGGAVLSLPLRPVTAVTGLTVSGAPRSVAGISVRSEGGRAVVRLPHALAAGAPVRVTVRAGAAAWDDVPGALREAVLVLAQGLDGDRSPASSDFAARMMASFRVRRLRGSH